MQRTRYETDTAPPSTGFRSQALAAGGFLFTGGQIGAPLAADGTVRAVAPTIEEQTRLCLAHLGNVTRAAGASAARVIELAAFVVQADHAEVVRREAAAALGALPPLVNLVTVADVAMHGLLELDWVVDLEPGRDLAAAAAVLQPFGHGEGVVRSGPFVFVNGLTAPGATLGEQSAALFERADALLREAGSGLAQLVKLTVLIADFDSYPQFNEVTRRVFAATTPPTRSVVVAPALTAPALLRVDLLALADA